MGSVDATLERINKIVESYTERLNFKKKKKPVKKKEVEKKEIQERAKRPCIFPECDQNIPHRGTSFCFDHKFFSVRKAYVVSQGYSIKDAEYYSKVKNFPIFLEFMKRKAYAEAGNNKKSR